MNAGFVSSPVEVDKLAGARVRCAETPLVL